MVYKNFFKFELTFFFYFFHFFFLDSVIVARIDNYSRYLYRTRTHGRRWKITDSRGKGWFSRVTFRTPANDTYTDGLFKKEQTGLPSSVHVSLSIIRHRCIATSISRFYNESAVNCLTSVHNVPIIQRSSVFQINNRSRGKVEHTYIHIEVSLSYLFGFSSF